MRCEWSEGAAIPKYRDYSSEMQLENINSNLQPFDNCVEWNIDIQNKIDARLLLESLGLDSSARKP
jgi:hypothetical protein